MNRGIRAVRLGWSPDSSGVGPRLSKKMHPGNPRRSYVSELISKKVPEKFGKKKHMPPSLQCQQTNTNPHTMNNSINSREAIKSRFEKLPTCELLDRTNEFHNRTEQGNATKFTREAWDIVLEILKERGI